MAELRQTYRPRLKARSVNGGAGFALSCDRQGAEFYKSKIKIPKSTIVWRLHRKAWQSYAKLTARALKRGT